MGLEKNGNKSFYKNDSFGIASDWLVTIFCIIYFIVSLMLGNTEVISMNFCILSVLYSFILLVVYWVIRNNKTKFLNITAETMLSYSTPEKFNEAEDDITSFRKLMLYLSNVPVVLIIISIVMVKYSKKKFDV